MSNIAQNVDRVRSVTPAYRISEAEDSVSLEIELPGVPKDSIEVSVERDELVIGGTVAEQEPEGVYLIRERRVGNFRKSFTIDDRIDRDKIDAVYANGVMNLTLHVKEAVKPRRIAIGGK